MANSLAVDGDLIFVGVRYLDKENYNNYYLITVFSKEGKKIKEIGNTVKCASSIGYLKFNEIFICIVKKKLFGTFKNRPIIFCYEFDGIEIFFKNLEDIGLDEIKSLKVKEKEEGLDTPETKKSDLRLRYLIYCYGFSVDKKNALILCNKYL